MNLVNKLVNKTKTEYTNKYIQAADVRGVLHNIFINNQYGFADELIKTLRETKCDYFQFSEDASTQNLLFNYNINNIYSSSSIDIRNVHAILQVEIMQFMSSILLGTTISLYNINSTMTVAENEADYKDNLTIVYNFLKSIKTNTKSAITMLFDIHIYMDHFVIEI